MDYKDYQKSRDMVWEILIKENVTELPIRVSKLCNDMGIGVKLYKPDDLNDGKCTIIHGKPVIFVGAHNNTQRQRFTAAHELGHILLDHIGKQQLVNREPSPNDNPIEQAANVFASRLLAPSCVLWGCNVRCADDIVTLCQISKKSAEYRMERMAELYKRNKFLTSPLERQVYIQFKEYIENHKL